MVILATIIYPPSFLFVLRQVLVVEAWRYGFHVKIGKME